jgi:hypothetical protein
MTVPTRLVGPYEHDLSVRNLGQNLWQGTHKDVESP